MRRSIVSCCVALGVAVAACSEAHQWEVVATFKPEVTDPRDGDECADLPRVTKSGFLAGNVEGSEVVWTVEVADRDSADRVAACFEPLATSVQLSER